jgi:hypothetical protein
VQEEHGHRIPPHLVKLLKLFGFDNEVSFVSLLEGKRVEAFQKEVREDIESYLRNDDDIKQYLGPFPSKEKFLSNFKISSGHLVVLQSLAQRVLNQRKRGSGPMSNSSNAKNVPQKSAYKVSNRDKNIEYSVKDNKIDLHAEEIALISTVQKSLKCAKIDLIVNRETSKPNVTLQESGKLGGTLLCIVCDKVISVARTTCQTWSSSNYVRHVKEQHINVAAQVNGSGRKKKPNWHSQGSQSIKTFFTAQDDNEAGTSSGILEPKNKRARPLIYHNSEEEINCDSPILDFQSLED